MSPDLNLVCGKGGFVKKIVSIFFIMCIKVSHAMGGECPIDVFVKEKEAGLVEIGLKNNTEKPYEIRYDQLPWVLAGRGIEFDVFVDGVKIRKASGAGHSSLIINIGANSYFSSLVDIGYLRSFYEGIEKERVQITWRYEIRGDNISDRCRLRTGNVAVP